MLGTPAGGAGWQILLPEPPPFRNPAWFGVKYPLWRARCVPGWVCERRPHWALPCSPGKAFLKGFLGEVFLACPWMPSMHRHGLGGALLAGGSPPWGSWLLGAPGPCSARRGGGRGGDERESWKLKSRALVAPKAWKKTYLQSPFFKNFLIKPFVFAVISSSCRPRIFQALSHPAPRGSGELRGAARPAEGDHTLRGLYCSRGGRFSGAVFPIISLNPPVNPI